MHFGQAVSSVTTVLRLNWVYCSEAETYFLSGKKQRILPKYISSDCIQCLDWDKSALKPICICLKEIYVYIYLPKQQCHNAITHCLGEIMFFSREQPGVALKNLEPTYYCNLECAVCGYALLCSCHNVLSAPCSEVRSAVWVHGEKKVSLWSLPRRNWACKELDVMVLNFCLGSYQFL